MCHSERKFADCGVPLSTTYLLMPLKSEGFIVITVCSVKEIYCCVVFMVLMLDNKVCGIGIIFLFTVVINHGITVS